MRQNLHIHVSDHALIRYIERVIGIDIEQLRRAIAENAELRLYAALFNGTGEFPAGDYKVCMENYSIVTILKNDQRTRESLRPESYYQQQQFKNNGTTKENLAGRQAGSGSSPRT